MAEAEMKESRLGGYVIQPGQSKAEVAAIFGVSVDELLEYNKDILGKGKDARWDAGVTVRNPSTKEKLVKEAARLGATAEQIAAAARMSVDDVVDTYGVLRADELQPIPKTKLKKIGPILREIRVSAQRVPEPVKQEVQYEATHPNEIDRVKLEDTLQEVRVDAKKVLEPVIPTKRDKVSVPKEEPKPELNPVETYLREIRVSAQKVPEQAIGPVSVPQRQRVPEEALAPVAMPQRQRVPEEALAPVSVPQRAGRFPEVEVKARRVSEQPLEVVPGVDPVQAYIKKSLEPKKTLTPVDIYFNKVEAIKERDRTGLVRSIAQGVTLGFADELEALASGEEYDVAIERIRNEMAEYELRSPRAAFYGEVGAALPTGFGVAGGLSRLGVKSFMGQGALETGAYGIGTGEDTEERLIQGAFYGAGGAIVGRIFDGIFDPSLGKQSGSVKQLNDKKTAVHEEILQEAKVVRPTAELSADELATQLLIRETEYLGDVVGRQGTIPSDLGSMLTRMRTYAEDMGVDMKQFNKVYNSNKEISLLRDKLNQKIDSLEELSLLRQDFLDMTTGRLSADVNRTIPQAQSTLVKLRRLASPLATLAEETVGTAFSQRIVRAMNRVTRGQTTLDKMWKGMEPFRELAQANVKFNDALLDVMNNRLAKEFREKRLQAAINIARGKIGQGAEARLNKFFDDNLEFSRRYRQEVTAGDLSRLWMHSNLRSTGEDVSLRSFRAKGQAKAEDAASKDIQRPSMKKWRKKNAGKDKEYENIFDSHWRWQRQTLTRLELGKQLGFRTAGKPLVGKGKKTLEETAAAESGSFKLFDDNIIKEALKREGYSDVQIDNAIQIIDDLGINANKGMSHELEMIRSLGYVGTIANPYGALMNVHDLFNASFELGVKNVLGALFSRNGISFSTEDMGLARQVFGDFVRKARKGTNEKLLGKVSGNAFLERAAEASESLLEASMKFSGFAKLDQFGKSRIMGASFRRARQDIGNGSFDNKWQYSFSKGELDQLKRDIAAGNTNSELVRDLVMFDLFKLQPINAAAQTAFGLANPNARLFYMLKGFAIKQFDLMERRIIKEWQAGNKRQALENTMKYLVLSGGGYGIVNEARQVVKGDAPDPEQMAMGALYQIGSVVTFGAMGANDYGYDKFMNDPTTAFMNNILPPVGATLPANVLEDTADVARALMAGETPDPFPDDTIYSLPIIGKILKGIFDDD